MSEAVLVRRIKKYLTEELGALVVRQHGGPYSERGVSDLLCCIRHPLDGYGQFVAIEIKTDRGVVSPGQLRWLAKARTYGALAFVARSVEDVKKELAAAGWLSVDKVDEKS